MSKQDLAVWLQDNAALLSNVARRIWERPELPMTERFAAELQAGVLRDNGFTVRAVPGVPTAFVAEYGQGQPVIGILGEYDALAGLSNQVSCQAEPIVEGGPGHGCGHNLLGTAGVGAALAVKQAMDREQLAGTVRYYGCPAEETLTGKVYMARAGVFDDLDASFYWHPAGMNAVSNCSFLAVNSVEFIFRGMTAHAAATPHLGRSALDAVELMNVGANYLREHIHEKARLHYTITNGGGAPNIVPAKASVWYYVRAPRRDMVDEIFCRLTKVAQGAAMMTETNVEWRFLSGCYDVLSNEVLEQVVADNLREAEPARFTDEDRQFAAGLAATYSREQRGKVMESYFAAPELADEPIQESIAVLDGRGKVMAGSIDVGDVSWIAPFAMFRATTWPAGIPSHTWQSTAASGSRMGFEGMLYAARVLAGTVYDLLTERRECLQDAKAEFQRRTGGQSYVTPLPPEAVLSDNG